ncbi:MAG: hypothetical protein M1837_005328 [Sclerophora amabilis]|nr:MAG: hypothetical protein M1837_005328 [Sclerophora amabilis]
MHKETSSDDVSSPSARKSRADPQKGPQRAQAAEIRVPSVNPDWSYEEDAEEYAVEEVLEETQDVDGTLRYEIETQDGGTSIIPFKRLLQRPNGRVALSAFTSQRDRESRSRSLSSPESSGDMASSRYRSRLRGNREPRHGYHDSRNGLVSGDEDELVDSTRTKVRSRQRRRLLSAVQGDSSNEGEEPNGSTDYESDSNDALLRRFSKPSQSTGKTRVTRSQRTRASKISYNNTNSTKAQPNDGHESDASVMAYWRSSPESAASTPPRQIQFSKTGPGRSRKRKRGKLSIKLNMKTAPARQDVRRSSRMRDGLTSMRERGEDDIWASESEGDVPSSIPTAVGVREKFKILPRDHEFRRFHYRYCDACSGQGDNNPRDPLVFCQGCAVSYHRSCLGPRNQREHVVTKIGEDECILQCRRCVGAAQLKDSTAPAQYACQVCGETGPACRAFRERKTPKQEQKEREENSGEDPIIHVDTKLINNVENVLFRCGFCRRAFHFSHLPSRTDVDAMVLDETDVINQRVSDYFADEKCPQCLNAPAKVQALVAWRPTKLGAYIPGTTLEAVNEDDKEYLIKWNGKSYFRCTWVSGAWVWGVVPSAMRRAFAKPGNGHEFPQMTAEDAIPEDYLRVDIVLDVQFTSSIAHQTEEVDKARVKEVKSAKIKFKGLGYEDVVWEDVPSSGDGERWKDFVMAYEDWVLGKYIHLPKKHFLMERLEKVRALDFETKVMKKRQPESLTGGTVMEYQLEGLNWLLYKWVKSQNAILADEMGLGKTIQVIAFLATLVHSYRCWPFLIVVPNSTCQNWRREIKHWAPSLRVVAYYGSAVARKVAMEHELFPKGGKDLKCHIVVTSYEAPTDPNSRRFFASVPWAGLIVDEGQRLKSDKTHLYEALSSIQFPYKLLMTGTPLQNDARELFNLLQFLDKNIQAARLEEEYAELTSQNVPELHDLLRPFFLRRTKAQVLTFLPPLAQIIVPVTMSIVQKKLYKSILAKNPQLIKSIFGKDLQQSRLAERSNLNNLLMQLRKCLCHPFVYSRAIEERDVNAAVSHRNLVDASSKLQLLEVMLPMLEERGHRVLIFSQFLVMLVSLTCPRSTSLLRLGKDIIEDFLDGLNLQFERLDGSMGSLQKQKRIDAFNAPNSPLFAFLLSTRAGGVGINLATADTVIIMDPDFNPHQDIQALSRAHRIGQKKKVLVFQLMTRDSAEEKIMQVGRKKMALDHVLIEQMDAEDDVGMDLDSILRHGAAKLFDDETADDIKYDSGSVAKLLDRSQVENTQTGADNSAESQFSFARVWAKDRETFEDGLKNSDAEQTTPDPSIWDKLLRERESVAAKERAAKEQTLGRGKRNRRVVDYAQSNVAGLEEAPPSPVPRSRDSESDTDFQEKADAENEADEELEETVLEQIRPGELEHELRNSQPARVGGLARMSVSPNANRQVNAFHRASAPAFPNSRPANLPLAAGESVDNSGRLVYPTTCVGCAERHVPGKCPLKISGVELCPLCGVAHFAGPVCPHLMSETQVRLMLEAIKNSPEEKALKDAARGFLRGRKGYLVWKKKQEALKAAATNPTAQQVVATQGGGQQNSYPAVQHQVNGIGQP